jgi:hypothetical protein
VFIGVLILAAATAVAVVAMPRTAPFLADSGPTR